jgi:hypothetical protein
VTKDFLHAEVNAVTGKIRPAIHGVMVNIREEASTRIAAGSFCLLLLDANYFLFLEFIR